MDGHSVVHHGRDLGENHDSRPMKPMDEDAQSMLMIRTVRHCRKIYSENEMNPISFKSMIPALANRNNASGSSVVDTPFKKNNAPNRTGKEQWFCVLWKQAKGDTSSEDDGHADTDASESGSSSESEEISDGGDQPKSGTRNNKNKRNQRGAGGKQKVRKKRKKRRTKGASSDIDITSDPINDIYGIRTNEFLISLENRYGGKEMGSFSGDTAAAQGRKRTTGQNDAQSPTAGKRKPLRAKKSTGRSSAMGPLNSSKSAPEQKFENVIKEFILSNEETSEVGPAGMTDRPEWITKVIEKYSSSSVSSSSSSSSAASAGKGGRPPLKKKSAPAKKKKTPGLDQIQKEIVVVLGPFESKWVCSSASDIWKYKIKTINNKIERARMLEKFFNVRSWKQEELLDLHSLLESRVYREVPHSDDTRRIE